MMLTLAQDKETFTKTSSEYWIMWRLIFKRILKARWNCISGNHVLFQIGSASNLAGIGRVQKPILSLSFGHQRGVLNKVTVFDSSWLREGHVYQSSSWPTTTINSILCHHLSWRDGKAEVEKLSTPTILHGHPHFALKAFSVKCISFQKVWNPLLTHLFTYI